MRSGWSWRSAWSGLRRGLRQLNLIETESLFPVQPLRTPERVDAMTCITSCWIVAS